jgi:probable HAF family extracellular repeat protein
MRDIGTLGGSSSYGRAINNTGQIVGEAAIKSNVASHAFLYSNGKMRDLGTLNGSDSFATRINNKGQVVGYSRNVRGGSDHPFLYSNGKMRDLNNLIPANSNCELINALSINDAGQIVANGLIKPNDEFRAFLLTPVAAN